MKQAPPAHQRSWIVPACHQITKEETIPDDMNAHVDGALHGIKH